MSPATLAALTEQAARPDGVYCDVTPAQLRQLLEDRAALAELRDSCKLLLQEVVDDPHALRCVDLRIIHRTEAALAKAAR